MEISKSNFVCETIDGVKYWFADTPISRRVRIPLAHLLPIYDEYPASYRNRTAAMEERALQETESVSFSHPLMVRGKIAGHWKRTLRSDSVMIHLFPFRKLGPTEMRAIQAAARQYGGFLKLPAKVM